jgi:hypothetical protein
MLRGVYLLALAGLLGIATMTSGRFMEQTQRETMSFGEQRKMAIAKDYILGQSLYVASFDETLLSGASNTLPVAIQTNLTSILSNGYGNTTSLVYCTGAQDAGNPNYAQNLTGVLAAQIVSPGYNQTIDTACGAASAVGDDILLPILPTDPLNTPGALGGFFYNSSTRTAGVINSSGNVDFSGNLVTIGNFASLPSKDAAGNAIAVGTVAFVPGGTPQLAVYMNGGWETYNIQ